MHLFELLSTTARTYPFAEAFVTEDCRCTFAQLHDTACTLALHFSAQGIQSGMRVAIACRNGMPFVYATFALMRLGAVSVPVNWRLTPTELSAQLEHADAAWLLHDKACGMSLPTAPQLRTLCIDTGNAPPHTVPELPPPPLGTDPACIVFTAGTSDSPRGVVLSHGNLLANSANYCAACGFAPGQRELATTQLFHISTFSRLFAYVRSATTCFLMKQFTPDACFKIMQREHITSITQTPTMYRMLQWAAPELRQAGVALTRVITGASAMSPTERRDVRKLFPAADLYDIYGQTEAGPGISVLGPQDFFRKAGSVGKPMPGVRIAIVDEKGCELSAGSVGEITCRGPNVMQGYFRNEAATHEMLVRGSLHTGDIGFIDEEGFLFIVGRKKDLIISGGINVYPPEIENVLRQHPGIADCAVFGVPDELWGESAVAAVVLKTATIEEVYAHCRNHLAGFKCPKLILPVPEIPRNPAGKVLRSALPAQWKKSIQQAGLSQDPKQGAD